MIWMLSAGRSNRGVNLSSSLVMLARDAAGDGGVDIAVAGA